MFLTPSYVRYLGPLFGAHCCRFMMPIAQLHVHLDLSLCSRIVDAQDCIPYLLYMLWPHNPSAAFLARHWACAIDVVELIAKLGGCSRPEVAGEVQRWDRRAWPIMGSLVPSLDPTNAVCSLTLRQAWCLTVRSERALREAAPHWGVLAAGGWGDVADSVFFGASYMLAGLVDKEPSAVWNVEDSATSLLQLLTSNAATQLKSGRLRRHLQIDDYLMYRGMACFHDIALRCSHLGPACQRVIKAAGPTIFFLLAPRHIAYAIHAAPSWSANRASGCCHPRLVDAISVSFWLHWMVTPCCSLIPSPRLSLLALTAQPMSTLLRLVAQEVEHSPEWSTPEDMDCAVSALSFYAESVASRVHQLASCGCEGAATGSSQLRDLLAQPVLCLLGSRLLDQLAMLQQAPTKKWDAGYCPSFLSPLDVSIDDEADIARQVIQVDPCAFKPVESPKIPSSSKCI